MTGGGKCEALGLDPIALGEAAAGILLAAVQLRHAAPKYTVRDYLHHSGNREADFLIDLFSASTDEMCERYDLPLERITEAIETMFPADRSVPKQKELGWGQLRVQPRAKT